MRIDAGFFDVFQKKKRNIINMYFKKRRKVALPANSTCLDVAMLYDLTKLSLIRSKTDRARVRYVSEPA